MKRKLKTLIVVQGQLHSAVPARYLEQWHLCCILPPPGHEISAHLVKNPLLPGQGEPLASTTTGPHCCRLEETIKKTGVVNKVN